MAAFYKFPKAVRELFLFHNIGFLPLFCLHFLSGSIEKRALKRNQTPPFVRNQNYFMESYRLAISVFFSVKV